MVKLDIYGTDVTRVGILGLCTGTAQCPEGGGVDLVELHASWETLSKDISASVLKAMKSMVRLYSQWVPEAIMKVLSSEDEGKSRIFQFEDLSIFNYQFRNQQRWIKLFPNKESLIQCIEACPKVRRFNWDDINYTPMEHHFEAMTHLKNIERFEICTDKICYFESVRPALSANGESLKGIGLQTFVAGNILELGFLCPNLIYLDIKGTHWFAEETENIRNFRKPVFGNLTHLDLEGMLYKNYILSEKSFALLFAHTLTLKYLSFTKCAIFEDTQQFTLFLQHGSAPSLSRICFDRCHVLGNDVRALLWRGSTVQRVSFSSCETITEDDVTELQEFCEAKGLKVEFSY